MGGIFTISLDCELYWGVRDKRTLESYRANLLGDRAVVPELLKMFGRFDVHATWATVGFLFFASREELLKGLPALKPEYRNAGLDPYRTLADVGADETSDPFHFAPSLIQAIARTRNQEVGSHTFSHYYCLEDGQTADAFRADMQAALQAARALELALATLVFPRNQFNAEYVTICSELGIKAYRGNQASWVYAGKSDDDESLPRRAVRLLDAYVNVTGRHCHRLSEILSTQPRNVPASRFLRPYSRKLKAFEGLRLRRIKRELEYAAENDLVYHLWWHPHNFGTNTERNLAFLEEVLAHFDRLKRSHSMRSLNMGEIAAL